ncbi:C-type lectin domain family 6 member A-like [Mya arenaria]|uniref:C-type lectin domain family 6 member A-like n=1 Tax=Mya arenaria TaxID=6604 RepID=UPI0022E2A3CD|nr:C-type lectin domain family 6 member A-like [Mya arenaria]
MFSSGPVCGAKCCNTSLCNTESCSHSSPTTATPPIPTHASANGCQTGNNWIDFGNSCYLIGARNLNWIDSQSYCNQNGGFLARIDTQAENDYIKAHLKSYPVQASYWIGLNKIRTNGVWTNTNTPAKYTDWAPGQPQSGADDCVVAAHYFGWAWGDYGCHMSNTHQLCEIPKTPSGALIG